LAAPLTFWEHTDELITFEQCRCVIGMREHVAGFDQQHVREGIANAQSTTNMQSVSRVRVLGHDRGADHRPVVKNDPGVVRNEQRPPSSRHIFNSVNLDAPVVAIEPERDALDSL
jgi:hypothetical protein